MTADDAWGIPGFAITCHEIGGMRQQAHHGHGRSAATANWIRRSMVFLATPATAAGSLAGVGAPRSTVSPAWFADQAGMASISLKQT